MRAKSWHGRACAGFSWRKRRQSDRNWRFSREGDEKWRLFRQWRRGPARRMSGLWGSWHRDQSARPVRHPIAGNFRARARSLRSVTGHGSSTKGRSRDCGGPAIRAGIETSRRANGATTQPGRSRQPGEGRGTDQTANRADDRSRPRPSEACRSRRPPGAGMPQPPTVPVA
jgi:hypothetical protein